jgi:hypothetical protein
MCFSLNPFRLIAPGQERFRPGNPYCIDNRKSECVRGHHLNASYDENFGRLINRTKLPCSG